jgi:putative addiction module component (TIGR02574 family)
MAVIILLGGDIEAEDGFMAPTLESLGIDKLSVDDRLALADAIWETVETRFVAPEWHIEELKRREALHAADPTAGVPWDVAMARLGQRSRVS